MSIVDKVIAAVTPPESDEAREEAYAKARALAEPGDWLEAVLDHHDALRGAFQAVKDAEDEEARTDAQEYLGIVLMGHAIAEEAVLYPALALTDQKSHAELGYNEQAMVKIQMAALDDLPKMGEDYLEKLDHIEGAVLHHMYEEEGTWFPKLKESHANQDKLSELYIAEFERYAGVEDDQAVEDAD